MEENGRGQLNPYVVGLLLVVIALVQTTFGHRLTILGVHPNLMFLAVLCWSMLRSGQEGMVWAFGGGMLLDLCSGAPFGASTLALLLVSFLAGMGEVQIFRGSLSPPLIISFVGSVLHDLAFLAVLGITGRAVDGPTALWRLVLPAAGLNMVLSPLAYILLNWLHQHTREPELVW